MKTPKIHLIFLITFAQLSYAQQSGPSENNTIVSPQTNYVQPKQESLHLTIPMIGNIKIRHANQKIRTATLALQPKNRQNATMGAISETKNPESFNNPTNPKPIGK